MKRILVSLFTLLALASPSPKLFAQDCDHPAKIKSIANCPPDGCGGDQLLNHQKNRLDIPQSGAVQQEDFSYFKTLHKTEPKRWKSGSDRSSLDKMGEGTPVQLVGYLLKAKHYTKPSESCNCKLPKESNNDFHLVIVQKPSNTEKQSVTAEMTPRMRQHAPMDQWTYAKLQSLAGSGTHIRVTGWLMFDSQHAGQASPARITHWEIHPATAFEVDNGNGGWTPLEDWNDE